MEKQTLEGDLGYINQLVRRSERGASASTIYYLWAVVSLVGFALVDFAPRAVGLYWIIAGPVGSAISGILAWRHGIRVGQTRRDLGIRHALHWGGMLGVIALSVLLTTTGLLARNELSKVILLILALGYWLGGVHFDRALLWVGLLMMVGYVATLVIPMYAWTALGILVALGLVVVGRCGGRSHAAARE